jgi:hypothetical protein
LRLKILASYKKINMKKFFFGVLKINEKEVGSGVGSGAGSGHGSGSIRGTDPGIRIRTKMSRIPNTAVIGSFRKYKNPAVH